MKINALAIGSRGDVQPFVDLGKEMVKHGHSLKVGGFVRHACEVLKIPCVRVFFYPFDKTNMFSVQMPERMR